MRKSLSNQNGSRSGQGTTKICIEEVNENVIPYDENLLENSLIQWQLGDWKSLSQLSDERLQHHPDRAKIVLLAAAGKMQIGESSEARKYIRLAQDWGVSKRFVSQILISGAYNSLGRAAAILGDIQTSIKYFESAIAIGSPTYPVNLITSARVRQEMIGLGLELRAHDSFHMKAVKKIVTVPKIIIINGMVRSGSTVSMNIVVELLESNSIPYMKYYIDDFENVNKLKDHVYQNPNLTCVLKTHAVNCELEDFVNSNSFVYIYTKRDLLEVAASFVRMSKNRDSPFFREKEVTLEDIQIMLETQCIEHEKAKSLSNLLILDCNEFADIYIQTSIKKIASHIGVACSDETENKIIEKFSRKASGAFCNSIKSTDLTSLGHERNTFFHNGHVMEEGTNVENELPRDWIYKINEKFKLQS